MPLGAIYNIIFSWALRSYYYGNVDLLFTAPKSTNRCVSIKGFINPGETIEQKFGTVVDALAMCWNIFLKYFELLYNW